MKYLYLITFLTLLLNLQVLGKTPIPFPKDTPNEKNISVVKNSSKLEAESSKVEDIDEEKPTLVTHNYNSLETKI